MKTYLEPKEVDQIEQAAECLRDKLLVRLLAHLGCRVSEALGITVSDIDFLSIFPKPGSDQNSDNKPDPNFLEAGRWLNIIRHPSIIVIIGARGSGKSALGYKIAEYLKPYADIYVVALPREARRLLPEWIGTVPRIEDVPPNSVVLVDESYTQFHSRTFSSDRARSLSNLINLSRQRGQTLIFVTQEGRQVDKNIVSSADIIISKNPGILQSEFERRELRKMAEEARRMFAAINAKDRNKWAYVYAPGSDFIGMIENSLRRFWTQGLSKAYADSTPVGEMVIAKKMSKEEKIKLAKELHRQGFTLGQIAKILGVSKSTVKNYLDDYPYCRKRKRY